MHELSIAQAVVKQATAYLPSCPGVKASTIRLIIGAFSGVNPAALKHAFPIVAQGSPLGTAELMIEIREPLYRCRNCNGQFEPEPHVRCPICSSPDIELETGDQLEIDFVEILETENE